MKIGCDENKNSRTWYNCRSGFVDCVLTWLCRKGPSGNVPDGTFMGYFGSPGYRNDLMRYNGLTDYILSCGSGECMESETVEKWRELCDQAEYEQTNEGEKALFGDFVQRILNLLHPEQRFEEKC
jgi:hypothetical protein